MEKLPHVVELHAPIVPEQLAALSVTRLRALPKPLSTRLLIQVAPIPLASVHLAALHGLCDDAPCLRNDTRWNQQRFQGAAATRTDAIESDFATLMMTTLRSRKVHHWWCSPYPHLVFRSGCVPLEQAIAYCC